MLPGESKLSLLQSNILIGTVRVGNSSRKVFTSLASRVEDVNDTRIVTKFSTVIFCGATAGNSAALEDILYSKFSLHVVEAELGFQVLTASLAEKLTALIAAKQFSEADKLILQSLQSAIDSILPSSSSGTSSFRLSSLVDPDNSSQPARPTDAIDTKQRLGGAKLTTTNVQHIPFLVSIIMLKS